MTGPPSPTPSPTEGIRPFVGRQRELELITSALDGARARRGRLLVLTGEPGIGKTRLADETASLAAGRRLRVFWGRCWEAGGAPAYWPWMETLEQLVREADETSLRQLGPGAALLAEIVPELRERLPVAGVEGAASGGGEARFALWRSVAGLIRRASGPDGLLLIFEDLHAADEASLLMLHFLAREARTMPLLLLASYRDVEASFEPAVEELLQQIAREGTAIPLQRLARPAAAALLAAQLGTLGTLDAATSGRIYDSTQGNPLFLEEMARLMAEEGAAAVTGNVVPAGVRAVIRQRLDRVPAEARPLLELAAVAGDAPEQAVLEAASGLTPAQLMLALVQARRAGVLVERAGKRRFGHALMREVLYQGLDPQRRQALHAAAGDAVARLCAGDPGPRLSELAHHALAGPPERLAQAVDLAIAASGRALGQLAYEEAALVMVRAEAAVLAAGNPPALRAKVALALGTALIAGGDGDGGKALCREAARLAADLGDSQLGARAALAYGEVFTFALVDPVLVDMLEEALAALPPGDSPLRVRVLARLASAIQPTRRTAEPVHLAREAIAAARRLNDPATLLQALHAAIASMMDIVHPRERLALNLETEQLALQAGNRQIQLRTHGRLALDYLGLGDLAAADARIDALEALARELAAPWLQWRTPLLRSMRASMHGRFAEAERLIAQALELGHEVRDPQTDRCVTMHQQDMLRVAERHAEMRTQDLAARRVKAALAGGNSWQGVGSALVASRVEDLALTRLHLDLIAPDDRLPADNLYGMFQIAEAVALVGPDDLAEQLLGLIENLGEQNVVLGMTELSWDGPSTRLLGLLEARLQRWEASFAHFEAAIATLERLDTGPYLARTRYEYARARLARASDDTQAPGLLEAARAGAEALGLEGLLRLIRMRQGALPAPAAAPAVVPAAPATTTTPAMGASAPADVPFTMVREAEVWALTHAGTTFRLKDSLGLQYLARLIADPGREIHVLDLAGGRSAGEASPAAEVADSGDAGELLDDEARHSYRSRLEDLQEELREAESFGDAARAARAREEIEFLGAELSRAVGLGGRARRAGSAAERARSAVQRRIKNALDRIAEASPALAALLSKQVKTGNFCSYRPG